MAHSTDGKKSKLMTYGMYAGAGLLVGVVAYYGYKMFSSKTTTAAPGAAASTTANASGHHHKHHKHAGGETAASWDCINHPNNPACNPSVASSSRSWDCQHHPEHPGCNPSVAATPNKVVAKKQMHKTAWI